jgi:hypothetical protein
VGRKNSGQARYDAMTQKELRRLLRDKKYKNPRKDGTDWTNKVLAKLTEAKEENENGGIN